MVKTALSYICERQPKSNLFEKPTVLKIDKEIEKNLRGLRNQYEEINKITVVVLLASHDSYPIVNSIIKEYASSRQRFKFVLFQTKIEAYPTFPSPADISPRFPLLNLRFQMESKCFANSLRY